ncbi:hypothetical protein LV178_19315, partial [Burkholderia mallei]|nr:hypothetical protein [Burkholderia mallei]
RARAAFVAGRSDRSRAPRRAGGVSASAFAFAFVFVFNSDFTNPPHPHAPAPPTYRCARACA